MKLLFKAWVLLNEIIWGFEVIAKWDGHTYRHPARNKREAKEWMRMYPKDVDVSVVSYGDDSVVMARRPVVCS